MSFKDLRGQHDERRAARTSVRGLSTSTGCVGDNGKIAAEAGDREIASGAEVDEIHATHAAWFEQSFAPPDRVKHSGGSNGYARSRGRNSGRANANTVDHFPGSCFSLTRRASLPKDDAVPRSSSGHHAIITRATAPRTEGGATVKTLRVSRPGRQLRSTTGDYAETNDRSLTTPQWTPAARE